MFAYIGGYAKKGGGIRCAQLDPVTGKLADLRMVAKAPNPSYLAVARGGSRLYASLETEWHRGKPGGAMAAYSINGRTGELQALGRQSTGGAFPCHVSVNGSGGQLFAANYGHGTVTVFPLAGDGSILKPSCVIKHRGSGPDTARQEGPHAHCAIAMPDGKLLVADLGIDRVQAYRLDAAGRAALDQRSSIILVPGSGPRHLVIHPNSIFVYVITELTNKVAAFEYQAEESTFHELCYVPTLPPDYPGWSWGAAVRVHPAGHTLYASNRGHDSIALFHIDGSGLLNPAGHVPSGGAWPRDIALTPDGRFLYAACEHSDAITAFSVDGETGELSPLGVVAEVPSPTSVVFAGE